jgi:hypothetical protein
MLNFCGKKPSNCWKPQRKRRVPSCAPHCDLAAKYHEMAGDAVVDRDTPPPGLSGTQAVSSSEQPVIQQQQQVQLLKEADRNLLLQSSVERLEGRSAMDQAVPRERQGHCETKIILAEDEVLVRIVLADALRREGFQVEAIDADDAIKH